MNLDEEPVGQHKELDISEHLPSSIESDISSKTDPLSERILNKNPKTRLAAMTELLKLFSTCNTEVFLEYYPFFPKYLSDTHPKIQELASQALFLLAENCPPTVDCVLLDIITVILEKCVTASKDQSRTKAIECLLKLAEDANVHPMIKEVIAKNLNIKVNPKVSAAALYTLTQLLDCFGVTYFPVSEFTGSVIELAGSTNTHTRVRALEFLKKGYKWDKITINKAIEALRPAQAEELKKQLTEESETANPLRTVKPGKERNSIIEESKKSKAEIYTEISSSLKFDERWCGQLMERKKWSEKRDMLEELIQGISVDKIRIESLVDLGKTLRILLQDSNLIVSNLALRAFGELAKTFKIQFTTCAKHSFELIIQKCKDKKSCVEAQKCLDNLTFSLRLEEMIEPIRESLNNRSPLIKSRVCMWMSSCIFPRVDNSLAKTMALSFGQILSKLTDDASSEVRDAALNCLGAIKCYLDSNPRVNKLIGALNSQKQERLEKVAEQMFNTRNGETRSRDIHSTLEEEVKSDISLCNNSEKKTTIKSKKKTQSMINSIKNSPKLQNLKAKGYELITEEDIGSIISPGDATKQVFENVPTMILAQFDMVEWKERQKGFKYLNEWIQYNPDKFQSMLDAVVIWLERKFGNFEDESQETINELLSLFKTICNKCIVNKRFAYEIIPVIVDRMKDEAIIETCIEIALGIAKSANPSYVAALCIKTCYQSNDNSSIMNGGLLLLTRMLTVYGAGLLPIKVTIDYAKDCLTNSSVSEAASQYIVAVHKLMGDSIKPWLADLDKSIYKLIEAELGQYNTQSQGVKHDYKTFGNTDSNVKRDSSLAKVNISSQLSSRLLSGLSAPLVKNRQEAKNELEKILQSANNNIASHGLSPLILALKGRMNDSCKSLAKGFITLVGNLAIAMGQGFKQYVKIILPSLISNLTDKQADIRVETTATMDKIAVTLGSDIIFNNIIQVLETNNTDGKTTSLKWILKHKNEINKSEAQLLIGVLMALIQEKTKEVKELAEELIGAITIQLGDSIIIPATKNLRPMAKSNLERILNKYKSTDTESLEETTEELKSKQKDLAKFQSIETEPTSEEHKEKTIKPDDTRIDQDNPIIESSSFFTANTINNPNTKTKINMKPKSRVERCKSPLELSVLSSSSVKQHARKQTVGGMTVSRSTSDLSKQFNVKRKSRLQELKKSNKNPSSEIINGNELFAKADNSNLNNVGMDDTKTDYKLDDTELEHSKISSVVIMTLGNKEGRAELEKKSKWSLNQVTKVNVDKLKKTLRICIEPKLLEAMFSNKPKKIISTANTLTAAIANEFTSLLDLLDLLCKWVAVKMLEQTGATVMKAMLEFLLTFFKKMEETQYKMFEFEASFIVPFLCDKLDISNLTFRQQFKELLKISAKLYNPARITSQLMNMLETTKNKKAKLECLKLIKDFIKLYDTNKIFIPKDIKSFVTLVNSSSNDLKAESLDILAEIYEVRGDSIWTLIGKLTEKTTELLKKRFNILNPNEPHKLKQSDSLINDLIHIDSKGKSSQRQSISKHSEIFYDDSINNKMKNSINKDDLFTHSIDKDQFSPSETESLFNATGKIESDVSPYIKSKETQSINSKILMTSMDNSKLQDEDSIDIITLEQALDILKSESISKRVNALMYLNEKIMSNLEEEKECLVTYSNKLLLTLAEVLKELFDKPVNDIPIRFAKYFMTVVSKVCANKIVIQSVNEESFSPFIEQIIMKILYDGLEAMGENNEGQYLVKAFNITVLRILEFYDPTKLFAILINLFMKYKDASIENAKMVKLPSLIAKCILKLTRSIPTIIENLSIPKVLLSLHECLLTIPLSAIPKSANDDIGIRMAKTIIYELIKIRGDFIWEDYKILELHQKPDLRLQSWIHHLLGSHYSASLNKSSEEPVTDSNDELQEICQELNSQQTFSEAIRKLSQYSRAHPEVDLVQYFSAYEKPQRDFVLNSLERYNNQMMNVGSTSEPRSPLWPVGSNDKGNSTSEYKSKLELLKQKFDLGNKGDEQSS